jgi:hypothetical protein
VGLIATTDLGAEILPDGSLGEGVSALPYLYGWPFAGSIK